MINTDRSSDTDFLTGFLRLFSYSLNRILIFPHRNSVIIGFLSCSQRSTCGGRIGHGISCRESSRHRGNRKLSKQQRLNTDTSVPKFRLIHLRTIHLVDSHPISNEIEYILCLTVGHNGNKNKEQCVD